MTAARLIIAMLVVGCNGDTSTKAPPDGGDGGTDSADGTGDATCVTDDDFWSAEVAPLLAADCVACHTATGMAGETRLLLVPGDDDATRAAVSAFLTAEEDGAQLILDKPTNSVSHGGGTRFGVLERPYAVLHEHRARVQAPGSCAHPGDAPITCDDGLTRPGPIELRRLTSTQVENSIHAVLGVTLPADTFPPTTRGPDFRTFATNNGVSPAGAESIMLAAEGAAEAVDLAAALDCGDTEAACARAWIAGTAPLLYRRDLRPDEETALMRFLDAGLDAETATRMAVETMLQSPQFLYLDAGWATQRDGVARLDDHSVAARLSTFLTDHPPDSELRAAADAGSLSTRAEVRAHAIRLLATPEAADVVAGFHRDWLDLYMLDDMTRDPERYPEWDADLIADLRTELDLFTTEVVWYGDGRLDTLLFSEDTWVNPRIAAIHGLDDPGEGWHPVSLDPERRPGALTRPAFLAAHGYAAASSPVRRGAWVLEEMLCEDLVPPPGVNMELPDESEETPTIRERLQQHWTDPNCASCHVRIDPIGYSMEHYGALGEWRDAWESGIAVDASGGLEDPAGDFVGAAEMLALVGASDRARACYAQRWFEYGMGRPAHADDVCSLDTLAQRFDAADGDIRTLMLDVAMTDAFLYRHTPDAESAAAEEAP
jgi:hypothetical protein